MCLLHRFMLYYNKDPLVYHYIKWVDVDIKKKTIKKDQNLSLMKTVLLFTMENPTKHRSKITQEYNINMYNLISKKHQDGREKDYLATKAGTETNKNGLEIILMDNITTVNQMRRGNRTQENK